MAIQHFDPITDAETLDRLFAESARSPVVLFKHDPYCSISAAAYRELAKLPDEVRMIDVAHDAPIARAVAERTGVRHESPQVIVLRDGAAVWHTSHFRISAQTVANAIAAAASQAA